MSEVSVPSKRGRRKSDKKFAVVSKNGFAKKCIFNVRSYRNLPESLCNDLCPYVLVGGTFERFVYWWQCAAVMQREVVTVMPSCSGGSNVVVA
jgi:hypothetical protein